MRVSYTKDMREKHKAGDFDTLITIDIISPKLRQTLQRGVDADTRKRIERFFVSLIRLKKIQ